MKKVETAKQEILNESVIKEVEARIQELEKSASDKKKPKATVNEIKRLQKILHRLYIDYKKRVMSFEEENYDKLLFLRSTNGFHKVFGHSLYFYAFDVAPKLDVAVNVYSDGDHEIKSEAGVVSVARLDELEKNFRKLKIERIKLEDKTGNVVIFRLPWKYTKKDIERFIEQNTYKKRRFNNVVMTENTIPTLYVNLQDLMKACYENVRRLEPVAREALGNMIVEMVAEMLRCYTEMGNGRVVEATGLKYIQKLLNKTKAQAKILSDLGLWNARTYARIGDIVIRIQDVVDLQLKKE